MGESSESPLAARAAESLDDDVPTDPFPPITPPIPPGDHVRVFGSRAFFRLWLAQVVSSLGDWIGFVAVVALAQRIGGSSPEAAIALVMAARLVPGFFFSQLAGVLVDRWNRKTVMVVCDVCRGFVLATLPFIHTVWGLVLASLLLEIGTLFWAPAKEASVPNLVPPDQLTTANSLSLVAAYGTFPIASFVFAMLTAVAGGLKALPGFGFLDVNRETLAIGVDVCTFFLSALMIATLPLTKPRRDPLDEGKIGIGSVVHDLKEGWHFILMNPKVRGVLLALGTGLIGGGMVVPLGPVFAEEVLDSGATGFGLLLTALGTGMAIGVILLSAFQKKLPKAMVFTASVLGAGITLILGASMSTLLPAFLAILGMGVFTGSVYVLGFTILHETVDDDLRGRTFSALYTLVRFCLLLAFALAPLLAGALNRFSENQLGGDIEIFGVTISLPGVRLALWLAGSIIVAAGLIAIRSLRSASATGRTRDL
ncbi:MAG TPA: MFS transporter [Acidimicrobiales bacterium]|nr:MFS transporter [Acidimicrobiales bacterium]